MWERFEQIFPEAMPAIRRLPLSLRILLFGAIFAVPLAGVVIWPFLMDMLSKGATVEVHVRMLVAAAVLGSLIVSTVWFVHVRLQSRARLRHFVAQWLELCKQLEIMYMRIDCWLRQDQDRVGMDSPEFREILNDVRDFYSRRSSLRRLLFLIGEESLVVKENQHWQELKLKQPIFQERDYLSPFGFILDIGAPIASINHYGEAIWASLFISEEYVEYLRYKHPFLERVAA